MRKILIAVVFGVGGCGPLALQHGARPVGKGKAAAGVSTLIIHQVGQGEARESSSTDVGPGAAFVRFGANDVMDAGLQVYAGGVRGDVKLLLANRASLLVSVSPGFHLGHFSAASTSEGDSSSSTTSLTGMDLTIAFARKVGENELYLAPRLGAFSVQTRSKSDDSTTSYRGWGAALGARWKVSEAVWLLPELGVYESEAIGDGVTDRSLQWVPAIGFATGF